ncbi:MAG: alpha/beta fold hydrolase [Thermodesulfobacteriota bacterium]
MPEPVMTTEKGDGIDMRIAVWQGADGRDVLCIHGLTANCRCWDLLAEAMAPPHRIIAPDLRGRGNSDKPPAGYSVAHHCRDLLALMESRKLARPVLMGHSLGALIALAFAARHPRRVDRLVLLDGGGVLPEEHREKVLAGIKPSLDRLGKLFPSVERYLASLKTAPFFHPWSPRLETYFRYEIETSAEGVRSNIHAAHILEEIENMKTTDPAELYPRITCPVLILRALKGLLTEDDILLPEETARAMVRAMPRSACVDIQDADHYSILFRPNRVRDDAIAAFLEPDGRLTR